MITALIITGIIVFTGIVLSIIGYFNVRKKFSYKIKTHNIEIITANYVVKLFVDGEERDEVLTGSSKWYNATLTTTINDNSLIVKIKRKNLISSPIIHITLNNEEIDLNNLY